MKKFIRKNFRKGKIIFLKYKLEYALYLIILSAILLLPNCAKTPEQKQLIKTGKTQLKIKLEGVVKPYRASKVLAPISGTIKEVFFQNGDWVNKGDILYKIKLDELDVEIKTLKREIYFIDNSIRNNRSVYHTISRAKRRLIEVAKTQLNRIATLYANGYATKSELEAAEEKYFRLLDEEETVRENYRTRNSNLVKQREEKIARLTTLEYKRNNSVVKAPISGYLTGSSLVADQEIVKGSVVAQILNLDKVVVKAGIASGLYKFIHKGDVVRLDFITTPPYNTTAKISKVIPIVDPKIGRMVAEIVLDNPNYILQDGTKALITVTPKKEIQSELYKDFYKKGSNIVEIRTDIK